MGNHVRRWACGWGLSVTARKYVLIGLGTALIAVAIGGLLIALWPRVEFARISHDIHGVDVSAHQGRIDWARLKADGVGFAYIKASEGGDFVDARFSDNWREAKRAGVPRGAYHFFTQCRSGIDQARNFIATTPLDADALPPVVDVEHMGPCTKGPASTNLVAEIEDFLDAVEARYGKRPILYTTRQFHDVYLPGAFNAERFWIRSLGFPPGFRDGQWVFWQYHNDGRRDGVAGSIDLNVFRGTQAGLDALR